MQVQRAFAFRRTGDGIGSTTHREYAMSKLRLSLDDLAVDTFQTADEDVSLRGTIHGNEATVKPVCALPSLKTDLTCCPCTPRM